MTSGLRFGGGPLWRRRPALGYSANDEEKCVIYRKGLERKNKHEEQRKQDNINEKPANTDRRHEDRNLRLAAMGPGDLYILLLLLLLLIIIIIIIIIITASLI